MNIGFKQNVSKATKTRTSLILVDMNFCNQKFGFIKKESASSSKQQLY